VNDARGPSVDSRTAKKAAADFAGGERLAHRACNTRKGAVTPVIPWPATLLVFDPAPLLTVPTGSTARAAARSWCAAPTAPTPNGRQTGWSTASPGWPGAAGHGERRRGGGQFLVALTAARRR